MENAARILLIDDDPVVRQTLAEMLGAAGYGVSLDGSVDDCDLILSSRPVETASVPVLPLTRPLRIATLLGSIRQALARRASPSRRLGKWRFDPAARLLQDDDGRKVRLTDKESAILAHLARDGGVVPRETLLAEIWNYAEGVTTHTLETHIYRLRRKLEVEPGQARLLVTEPGGYRLDTIGRGDPPTG